MRVNSNGSIQARSKESFGVSGLLEAECRVFYESFFSTRHLGRSSDLLSARLKKSGLDELKLRGILLHLIMEAIRAQLEGTKPQREGDEPQLSEPVVVECGIDNQSVAVGVSFTPRGSHSLRIQGLSERLKSGAFGSELERATHFLLSFSQAVILKHQPSTGRIELIAVFPLSPSSLASQLEIIEVPANPEKAPSSAEVQQLGDLPAAELLKDDSKVSSGKDKSGVENRKISGSKEKSDDEKRKVKGGNFDPEGKEMGVKSAADEADSDEKDSEEQESKEDKDKSEKKEGFLKRLFGGGKKKPDDKKKVKGSRSDEDAEERSLSSDDSEDSADSENQKVKGSGVEGEEDQETRVKGSKAKKGRAIGVKSGTAPEDDSDSSEEDEEKAVLKGKKSKDDQGKIKVRSKGDSDSDSEDEDEARLSGKSDSSSEGKTVVTGKGDEGTKSKIDPEEQAKLYGAQISRLNQKIQELEEERKAVQATSKGIGKGSNSQEGTNDSTGAKGRKSTSADESASDDEAPVESKKKPKSLLKKLWPFGDKEEESKEDSSSKKPESKSDAPWEVKKLDEPKIEKPEEKEKPKDPAPEDKNKDPVSAATDRIAEELESGSLGKTLDRAKDDLNRVKQESQDQRMKKWADNLAADLMKEKARVGEMAKTLQQAARSREADFKRNEEFLKQEARKKDEMIRATNTQLERRKEQYAELMRSNEALKAVAQKASEDAAFKQKYEDQQRQLMKAREDQMAMKNAHDELKAQLLREQAAVRAQAAFQTEATASKQKAENALRSLEDFKKKYAQVVQKLGEATKGQAATATGSTGVEDMKRKLDAMTNREAANRKLVEEREQKIQKMLKEQGDFKADLAKKEAEIRKLKSALGGESAAAKAVATATSGPGGSGGKPNAA